jgi:hypothetical protein
MTHPTHTGETQRPVLTEEAGRVLLGIQKPVPMTHRSMADSLRVTFFPYGRLSERVAAFAARLRDAMMSSGVEVVPFDAAVEAGRRGKIQEGIIIIAPGTLEEGKLPVDFVPNLRTNTVVGIVDGPCPARKKDDQQEKLNTIVEALVWSIVQVIIYVDDPEWTVCTMNGAIIPCGGGERFREEVYATLVPKLAAPVVPPHASDFQLEEGELDLYSPEWEPYVRDFEESSPLWAETGVMLFHTSLSAVRFRNTYYKRVAAAYLDKRSGMSYGFLSRQPAFIVPQAQEGLTLAAQAGWRELEERGIGVVDDAMHVFLRIKGRTLVVPVPDVAVLATRSGCDKSHVNGHRDLVLLGIRKGIIYLQTPKGLDAAIDARPSYDTLTILAHGIANSLIASVLKAVNPSSPFLRTVGRGGMALAHWHGDLDPSVIPGGYAVFGEENPPVSCSTYQAALYTLSGKLGVFGSLVEQGKEYLGDVHIEPHHGINVTWPTLTGLATTILGHTSNTQQEDRERMTA